MSVLFLYLMMIDGVGSTLCLEYKIVEPNLPGRLGSVRYQTMYITEDAIRIDFGADISKILDFRKNIQIDIDHGHAHYRSGAIEKATDEIQLSFVRDDPFKQTFQQHQCRVYVHQPNPAEGTYSIKMWYADLADIDQYPVMETLLGFDENSVRFPNGTPSGFPVHVAVFIDLEGTMTKSQTLSLIGHRMVKTPAEYFAAPRHYVPRDEQP